MRALSKQLTQKWPDALWRLAQRAWAPLSRDNAPRLRLPLSGACQPGTVYLVGAGSGDVELLTLKAARLLMQADAVVYDRLVGDDVLGLVPPGTERYYVGKASGHHSMPQAEIGALIVSLAQAGKSVVRLKGGDPGVFGRMGEELAALAEAGLPAEIVPGITAASAAAAGMGIPLTDRGHGAAMPGRRDAGLGVAGASGRDPGVLHGAFQSGGHLPWLAPSGSARYVARHAGSQRQPARAAVTGGHAFRHTRTPRCSAAAIALPNHGGQRGEHGGPQPRRSTLSNAVLKAALIAESCSFAKRLKRWG